MWKKKLGPLPAWAWGGILLAAALLWSLGQSRAQAKDTGAGDATSGGEVGTVPSDQVPDFISQVYSTTINNLPSPTPETPPPADTPPTKTAPPSSPPKTTTPPKSTPKPAPKPAAKKPISYKVKHGDSLSSIAKKYGTTWQALWAYNTKAGVRPADTIKTLKARGPSLLYSGETILIPQK